MPCPAFKGEAYPRPVCRWCVELAKDASRAIPFTLAGLMPGRRLRRPGMPASLVRGLGLRDGHDLVGMWPGEILGLEAKRDVPEYQETL